LSPAPPIECAAADGDDDDREEPRECDVDQTWHAALGFLFKLY
jgi:hypothetical protein